MLIYLMLAALVLVILLAFYAYKAADKLYDKANSEIK